VVEIKRDDVEKALLKISNVGVVFGGLKALSEIDLAVLQGEIVGLLGPNGAGKTTLLNVISGYTAPTTGAVLLDEAKINGLSPEARARKGIARTFQAVRLFGALTVRENIEVAALSRLKRSEARAEAARLMERFGIQEMADRAGASLSYAQERLVGIARALALNPRFLLLDEPAAGMTETEISVLADMLIGVRKDFGCALLLVEHNMALVRAACDRLHVLAEGRTLVTGHWDSVSINDAFRDAYLGAVA
jgi:branched-chain amino acid transport system ATP-binding protein